MLALAAATLLAFDPVDFFRGRTHGDGILKVILQSPKKLSVDSVGTEEKDGTLVIRQVVREAGKPERIRYWRLRALGGGRFEGTLTDAVGPVRIDQQGDIIRIRYKSKDSLDFDQTLTPAGPRTLANKMRVKRFGIVVAHVTETIRKVD
jgi:hypothetical protein